MRGHKGALATVCLFSGFLALPLTASAQPFVGLGLGYGSINLETEATVTTATGVGSASEDDNEGAPAIQFTAGVDRDASRTYGLLKVLPYEDAIVSVLGVSHDWKFGDGPLKPFLGVSLGLAMLRWTEDVEVEGVTSFDTEDETASSLGLGAQAGVLYDVDDSLSVEAGLRFLATELSTELSFTEPGAAYEVEQTVESLVSVTVGFNYRF